MQFLVTYTESQHIEAVDEVEASEKFWDLKLADKLKGEVLVERR